MEHPDIEQGMRAQLAVEELVSRHLDHVLKPRGFGLVPHGFALSPDRTVTHEVIYEAEPGEYARRYPALRERFDGDVPCIDLCIDLGDGSAVRSARLEVDDIWDLLIELDAPLPSFNHAGLDAQLSMLGASLRIVLDGFAARA